MAKPKIVLTEIEDRELQRRGGVRAVRTEVARRARVILEVASGRGIRPTAAALACSTSFVQRWADRFRAERLAGLIAQRPSKAPAKAAIRLEARILKWTRRGPDDGSTQWSSRRLARKLETTHMTIARVWRRHGL